MKLQVLVKEYRYKMGISQKILQRKTKIPQSTISDIENGKCTASVRDALLIAEALECRVGDIFIIDRDENRQR